MIDQQKQVLTHIIEHDIPLDEQIESMRLLSIDTLSVSLIVFAVEKLCQHMHAIDISVDGLVDLVGTGGDGSNTFNISTTASFVAAGAGISLAKHGNVSITSKSGSFDLLKALHVTIPQSSEEVKRQLEDKGLCFLFAPYFHPIFGKFKEARKALAAEGQKTLFNILGPLLNPARVKRLAVGVFSPDLVDIMAHALHQTGAEKALVFCGDGMDELSVSGQNIIAELKNGKITTYTKQPSDFGFEICDTAALKGGTPEENAAITKTILSGADTSAKTDIVILNAAAALYVAHDDLDFTQAIAIARQSLHSGAALNALERNMS